MITRYKGLISRVLTGFLVVGFGAWEGWYGKFKYTGDAVAYLDMAKAIRHGDWHLALNPYWSIGYPLILAMTRWVFPPGAQSEWTAVHVVNLVVYVLTYISFLFLVQVACAYLRRADKGTWGPDEGCEGPVFILASSLFVLLQLLVGNVSNVSPDLAVTCVFFLMMATGLRFCLQPRVATAILLGLLMGLGYIVKVVLLPISLLVFSAALLHSVARSPAERGAAIFRLAWALPALALVMTPYVSALWSAVGAFTLGESGSLNYAWGVNHLPYYVHWQGSLPPLGAPIHPTHLVLSDPPVFQFDEPIAVTYPPWYNPYYWYQGYGRFFNLGNQLEAVGSNLDVLRRCFFRGPLSFLAWGCLMIGLLFFKDRRIWWDRLVALWPFYLPSIGAIGLYLMVFVEARYIIGFLLVILLAPFLPLFVSTQLLARKTGYALALLISAICALLVVKYQPLALDRSIHLQSYTSDADWRVGLYLAQSGVPMGAKVASVKITNGTPCWAYVGGFRIVAEIGNSAFDPQRQLEDFQLFVRNPAVQQTVLQLFRQAGAVLVVAFDPEEAPVGSGWQRIPGTGVWVDYL